MVFTVLWGAFLDNYKEYFEANYLFASVRQLKFEINSLLAISLQFYFALTNIVVLAKLSIITTML